MRTFLTMFIIIAFLDNFVQLPIMSPFAQSMDATPLMIGFIIGIYSFTNLIGNLLAGKWIDDHSAKTILIIGMLSTAFIMLLYTIVNSPWQLASVRTIHGLSSGLLAPSVFTLVSRRSTKYKQGRNMARSGAAVGLAAVIGPAMSGILTARYSINSVFIVVACLMIAAAFLAWLRLSGESQKREGIVRPAEKSHASTARWKPLLTRPAIIQTYAAAFSLMFTLGTLTYVLPLKAQALQLSEQTTGLLFSTFGIVAIIIFILPTNRIFEHLASRTTMLSGMFIIGLAIIALGIFDQVHLLYSTMCLYGIGFALLFPSMNALLVAHAPEADRGKAFGLFYAFFSIGVVVGSMTIGFVAPTPDGGLFIAAGFMLVITLIIGLGGRIKGWSDDSKVH